MTSVITVFIEILTKINDGFVAYTLKLTCGSWFSWHVFIYMVLLFFNNSGNIWFEAWPGSDTLCL